ncbi:hypothetical protein PHYBLDRAFT_79908 [Phycomyces blakesleeanus NRRL 1555(-)]|uniref:Nucleoporin Nup82 n=1 Tax=Phycomyces blakesleeanus (strain ATCC 8743b / DSM 1359 / FGSC 10004 / NBRC 33097 / NRRL 1555) TaxID=763407 RepID=A0A167JAB5_PHYB8|nr:hypothetical protein PHYBLDRAFT_79908 [Phycomyces blakesleeanus NRRL 1555(-)]OAD65589.1 hypothetical protein PHYBLDRAFT_79908 [Phycomyces blakesleeanus NRRL 1555(-)]|eukprot:XP_018283629.1 hypothetical protein PHYBLDRAFT_79908 [Phycomyces blakesleeanus NRRL 1555(-)]
MSTSWPTSLSSHPIFRKSDKSLLYTANILATDVPKQSLIAVIFDIYLLVAVSNEIRILNLYKFNKQQETAEEPIKYNVVSLPLIDFEIVQILPCSETGVLVVAGEYKLAAVQLQKAILDQDKDHTDPFTCFIGQPTYYTGFNNVRIIKMEWHPLSTTSLHLMILDNQNILRMFDIGTNLNEPEQTFDLSPPNTSSKSLVSDFKKNMRVTSFTTGGESSASKQWEPLTVFYTLDNGHIYALCPVLPNHSKIKARNWLRILDLTETKLMNNKKEAFLLTESFYIKENLIRLQLEWLQRYTLPCSLYDLEDNDIYIIYDAAAVKHEFKLQKQGPFVITGATRAASPTTDILFTHKPAINVLAIAYAHGAVGVHFLSKDIDAQWNFSAENINTCSPYKVQSRPDLFFAKNLPTATLYETIHFEPTFTSNVKLSVRLIKDPLSVYKIYCQHSGGIHALSFKPWMHKIQELDDQYEANVLRDEIMSLVESWPVEEYPTIVSRLIYSGDSKRRVPMLGAVITTKAIGYSLIGYFWDSRSAVLPLTAATVPSTGFETTDEDENEDESNLTYVAALTSHLENIKLFNNQNELNENCRLAFPLFRISDDLADCLASNILPIYVLPKDIGTSKPECYLDKLTANAAKTLSVIQKLDNTATEIEKRVAAQKLVYENQTNTLEKLSSKLDNILSVETVKVYREKLENAVKNYSHLVERVKTLSRSMADIHSPDVTVEELELFKQISILEYEIDKRQNDKDEFKKAIAKLHWIYSVESKKASKSKESRNLWFSSKN